MLRYNIFFSVPPMDYSQLKTKSIFVQFCFSKIGFHFFFFFWSPSLRHCLERNCSCNRIKYIPIFDTLFGNTFDYRVKINDNPLSEFRMI